MALSGIHSSGLADIKRTLFPCRGSRSATTPAAQHKRRNLYAKFASHAVSVVELLPVAGRNITSRRGGKMLDAGDERPLACAVCVE
jgi:hypothetical protein